jgi:hypothetical protein
MKEGQKKESAGNCGRTELVLGTEANGDALSFCPGENVTHTENWAERISSVLGKTNRQRKNCAGETLSRRIKSTGPQI